MSSAKGPRERALNLMAKTQPFCSRLLAQRPPGGSTEASSIPKVAALPLRCRRVNPGQACSGLQQKRLPFSYKACVATIASDFVLSFLIPLLQSTGDIRKVWHCGWVTAHPDTEMGFYLRPTNHYTMLEVMNLRVPQPSLRKGHFRPPTAHRGGC